MKTEKLLVKNCPYCELIKSLSENTKLYYPNRREEVSDSDFIIVDCEECNVPIVIYGEHITELTKETYGRILHRCKMLFGNTIKIGNKHRVVQDHWCLHCKKDY